MHYSSRRRFLTQSLQKSPPRLSVASQTPSEIYLVCYQLRRCSLATFALIGKKCCRTKKKPDFEQLLPPLCFPPARFLGEKAINGRIGAETELMKRLSARQTDIDSRGSVAFTCLIGWHIGFSSARSDNAFFNQIGFHFLSADIS